MRPHTWTIEEFNGGALGPIECWICLKCGSSGGPAWPGTIPPKNIKPFLAGAYGKKISDDCDEARQQIAEHQASENES